MFLSWIAKCELLTVPEGSRVLKGFSVKCQRSICSTVVNYLGAESVEISEVLPTRSHIQWAMEALGNSFTLSMNDAEVVIEVIKIYEKWLYVDSNCRRRDSRPKCMMSEEQELIQQILGHMSLLFEDRQETKNVMDSKNNSSSLLDLQVSLCQKVLDIFTSVGRDRGDVLSQETWDKLLRILLGMTDSVLHGNKNALGSRLCYQIFRTLIEMYLRSLTKYGPMVELWSLLPKFCRRWVHRKGVLTQWNAISSTLSRQLMDRLDKAMIQNHYDFKIDTSTSGKKNEIKVIWADRHTSTIKLDDTILAYAWYQVLRVTGHPSHMNDPEVYLIAINGISDLADIFMNYAQVGKNSNSWEKVRHAFDVTSPSSTSPPPKSKITPPANPDLNTIFRLLGPWLFDACLARSNSFLKGRARAVQVLGRLLTTCGNQKKRLAMSHSIRFLATIPRLVEEKESDVLLASLVHGCCRIFGAHGRNQLPGVNLLHGTMFQAVEKLYKKIVDMGKTTSPSKDEMKKTMVNDLLIGGISVILLKRSCLVVLSSLLQLQNCLPEEKNVLELEKKHLPQELFGLGGVLSTLPRIKINSVITLLLLSLKTETDPCNQQITLWLLYVAIQYENIMECHSQMPAIVKAICSGIVFSKSMWSPSVLFTAFDVLRHISSMSNIKEASRLILSSCCDFISTTIGYVRTSTNPEPYYDALVSAAFGCLLEWCSSSNGYDLFSSSSLKQKLLQATVLGSDLQCTVKPTYDVSIRMAANLLRTFLLKHCGQYTQHTIRSTNITEQFILGSSEGNTLEHCRFFVSNGHTLLTVIEQPDHAIVICRNATGRYAWHMKTVFNLKGQKLEDPKPRSLPFSPPSPRPCTEDAKDQIGERHPDPLLAVLTRNRDKLSKYYKEQNEDAVEEVEDDCQNEIGNETKLFELILETDRQLEDEIPHSEMLIKMGQVARPEDEALINEKTMSQCKWQYARRVLTQLGLVAISKWGDLYALEATSELIEGLYQLDQIPEREIYQVGIAYTWSGGSLNGFDNLHVASLADSDLVNQNDNYLFFLDSIGWLRDHRLYYATYDYEVQFATPSLEEVDLTKSEVLIVWNECGQQYDPKSAHWSAIGFPTPSSQIVLLIDPLEEGLFRIRVCNDTCPIFQPNSLHTIDSAKENKEIFGGRVLGPLQDGMVVGKESLGKLVRQTALNAARLYRAYERYEQSTKTDEEMTCSRPTSRRARAIEEIVEKHSLFILPGEFYKSLFTDGLRK